SRLSARNCSTLASCARAEAGYCESSCPKYRTAIASSPRFLASTARRKSLFSSCRVLDTTSDSGAPASAALRRASESVGARLASVARDGARFQRREPFELFDTGCDAALPAAAVGSGCVGSFAEEGLDDQL